MHETLSKADARAWMRRWRAVNEAAREELRATPLETKFRRLAALMHTARVLNWKASTEAEDEAVRERWNRLKRLWLDSR